MSGTEAVSTEAIEAVVAAFMEEDGLNSPLIPDALERKLYKNTLKLVMTTLHKALETTHVELLGHRVTFQLAPAP